MLQSDKKGARNKVGALGEAVCCQFLIRHGYTILEQNYLQKWGEIDIIAKKEGRVHFVEVKTVSHETRGELTASVSRGTWRPEENVHREKLARLGRTIETWIAERAWEGEFQIDVAAVRVVPTERYATVKYLENVGAE